MLQDWELGLAVNHALRYIKPDDELREAIVEGRMRTKADVKREVERMLADESIRKPRILQFLPRLLRLRFGRLHLQGLESAWRKPARPPGDSLTTAPCSTERQAPIA